ncbi:2-dehydro-3-deoxygalactonokinase [Lichenicoccus sp.]|uniref:2-dehydro-3-deoxygalactonokinase n=1 Tax=Lichenicoccus sp. TaxID=2781899 RepID=UPI003D09A358
MMGTDGLIALDWGTSSLRAWLVSPNGTVRAARQEGWGIMHLPEGGYPVAYAAITEGWHDRARPAIACGMVGSRQGWLEVPYLPTPAGLETLAGCLRTIQTGAGLLHLVPGVLEGNDAAAPDVMRGEETQAVGAMRRLGGDALLVLPGTHSKWARLQGHRLVSFETLMTGELYALLSQHSILGRAVAEAPEPATDVRDAAFDRGVLAAQDRGALARLFGARALMLTGAIEAGAALDYLSGLLIGEELRLAAPLLAGAARVALTGDDRLCARYVRAFQATGRGPPERIDNSALQGLLDIAAAAGLVPSSPALHQPGT